MHLEIRGNCGTDGVGHKGFCEYCHLCPRCEGDGWVRGVGYGFAYAKCLKCMGTGRLDNESEKPSYTYGDEGSLRCGPERED